MAAKDIATTPPRIDAARSGPGLGTWWWDIANNTLAWDEAMHRLFGVPPEATVADYDAFLAYVHSEDRATVNGLVSRALMVAKDYEATFRVVRSDGEIPIIAARGVVYHDADGKPARMIGVCWDATAQRIADEALRTNEARYRGLVESQQDLLFRFDLEERVTFANDAYCAKFGLRRDEILGSDAHPFAPGQPRGHDRRHQGPVGAAASGHAREPRHHAGGVALDFMVRLRDRRRARERRGDPMRRARRDRTTGRRKESAGFERGAPTEPGAPARARRTRGHGP